jgi:uncharacterized membrane protein
MVSEKFRHQLRQEAEQWQAEGLIDEPLYAELARRYQFNDLASFERNRFVTILMGVGSVVLCLAAIAFVAAYWQVWPKELKLASPIALWVSINGIGFYLWQRPLAQWHIRLGKGLLLLGALILGANIALISRLLQPDSTVYQLFLIWGLAILAMAYSLRLTFLGILALVLLGIGYSTGIVALLIPGNLSSFRLVVEHMPLLISLLVIPLAYWCRSLWLFAWAVVLVIFSLEANTLIFLANFINFSPLTRGMMGAIACSLPPALLWAYRDSLWNIAPHKFSCDSIARKLAIIFISLLFYIFSFNTIWKPFVYRTGAAILWHDWVKLLDILLLGCLTIWAWWRLGYREDKALRWRLDRQSTLFGAAIATCAAIVWWHISVEALGAIATLIFNIFLLFLAVGLIRQGLFIKKRRHFWSGVFLVALQLISRLLEYETDWLAKTIVFTLCSLATMTAMLWFEGYLLDFLHKSGKRENN